MTAEFAPKGEEVLRTEALEVLGVDTYEGNEEIIDRLVGKLKTEEEFKASVHNQKKNAQTKAEQRAELLKKNGFDPETGEKLTTNVVEAPKNDNFSARDFMAIKDLDEADVDFVLAEAKLRGLTVSEAKSLPIVKSALKMMAEERKTAEATNTGTQRTRNNSNSDEAILKEYSNKLPDSQEEMDRLVEAQLRARIAKSKR